MSMKGKEKNREVIGIIDNDMGDSRNSIQEYNLKHKRMFLLHIYPYNKIDFLVQKCTLFHIFKSVDRG